MTRFEKGIRNALGMDTEKKAENTVTIAGGSIATGSSGGYGESSAMKLSAVDRAVELISDSVGKLPIYILNKNTKERIDDHPLLQLLTVRPNPMQTPFQFKKMLEASRLCGGNGYAYIVRDRATSRPVQLLPIPYGAVTTKLDKSTGTLRYSFRHPFTDQQFSNVPREDMIHVMGYSRNGYLGISVLERAAEVINASLASQAYAKSYYENGGQPSGVLTTETDLGGTITVQKQDGTTEVISRKDIIRTEWQKLYGGAQNAGKIAVLDQGLKYSPIAISNKDAQFVEQADISVQDIARFFGVPLYKLQSGKQSYNSNEQNAVEYVVGTLHPIVEHYQQELTYQLLPSEDIASGLEIRINMLAELKGDTASRGAWYRNMREVSAFSPNDIRSLEDYPAIEGGGEYYASLNYVPLADWKELSRQRAGSGGGSSDGGGESSGV